MSTENDCTVTARPKRPRVKLTATMARTLPVPEGTCPKAGHAVHDSEVRGLRLVAYPGGSRSWQLYYRLNGRQRRMTLGDAGSMSPEVARQRARAALVSSAMGVDPRTSASRRSLTMGALWERYLREHAKLHKKSWAEDERMWARYLAHVFGPMLVDEVKTEHIARFLELHGATPYMANRLRTLLATMFSLAKRWHVGPAESPVAGTRPYRESPRHYHLGALDLARLGEVLRARESTYPVQVAVVKFLLFTGWRRNEALLLRWTDVDMVRRVAHLQDSKTGARDAVLSAPAVEVLANMRRAYGDAGYVFPSQRHVGQPYRSLDRFWSEVRTAAGLAANEGQRPCRVHDLRHAVGERAAADGVSLFLVGKLLGHAQATTSARYAQVTASPIRAAADATATSLASALDRPVTES